MKNITITEAIDRLDHIKRRAVAKAGDDGTILVDDIKTLIDTHINDLERDRSRYIGVVGRAVRYINKIIDAQKPSKW